MERPDPVQGVERVRETALACGFTSAGPLNPDTLVIRAEVRDACAADKCQSYGKNWSCPPACGTLEECEKKIRRYQAGFILQTTGTVEDSFDFEAMTAIAGEHNGHLKEFQKKLWELFPASSTAGTAVPWLLLGSGACRICETCSCPETPCRFPGSMIVSMEAMGLWVSDVCSVNGLPYNYGPGTLTYVGCVLFA